LEALDNRILLSLTTPAAPNHLQAYPVTNGNLAQISVNWTAPPGTICDLCRGIRSGGENYTYPIASGLTGTTYCDTVPATGAAYFYTLKAVNAAGTSPASAECEASVAVATPDGSGMNVTWPAAPGNVTGYDIYCMGPGGSGGSGGTTPIHVTTASYLDTNVLPNTQYSYMIDAISAAGATPLLLVEVTTPATFSTSDSGTTQRMQQTPPGQSLASNQTAPAPGAVTDLQATVATDGSQITLNWSAPSGDVSYYQICRATAGQTPAQAAPIGIPGTWSSYTDTAATPGTQYWYFIQAINSAGPGTAAGIQVTANATGLGQSQNSRTQTLDDDDTIPDAPPYVGAMPGYDAAYGGNNVVLYWSAPSQTVTSYQVFRSTSPGGEDYNNPIATVDGDTCYYIDDAPAPATQYYYTIVASNDAGSSDPSTELPVLTAPAAPQDAAAIPVNASEITLNWSDSINPAGDTYNIYRSDQPNTYGGYEVAAGLTACTYNDVSYLQPGTTYYYYIAAVDSNGTIGDYSDQVSATTAPAIATAASASASTVTGNTVDLSVLGASDLGESSLSYTWSVASWSGGNAASSYATFSDNGENSAKDTIATLYAPGVYSFLATITDADGASNTSSVSVTVDQTLTSIGITPDAAGGGATTSSPAAASNSPPQPTTSSAARWPPNPVPSLGPCPPAPSAAASTPMASTPRRPPPPTPATPSKPRSPEAASPARSPSVSRPSPPSPSPPEPLLRYPPAACASSPPPASTPTATRWASSRPSPGPSPAKAWATAASTRTPASTPLLRPRTAAPIRSK
jgi:fibronectin type 3 domain-containing protein